MKTSLDPLRTIATASADDNKIVDQVLTKTRNPPTVADQLVTNLKLLNITDKKKNLETNDFPALPAPMNFSSALKARKSSKK